MQLKDIKAKILYLETNLLKKKSATFLIDKISLSLWEGIFC